MGAQLAPAVPVRLGSSPLRTSLAVAALLVAAAAVVGWSQLTGYAWTDYEAEAELPLARLAAGNLGGFVAAAPAYGGSFVIRAPFALLPSLWGGGHLAVYRSMAVPCLLAGAALGWVLWRRAAACRWALVPALLAAANPVTLQALDLGHPEELLGAALCAGAVIAAAARRPWVAALLLGLAIGNKAWAVLACGPVLVALDGRRLRVLAVALLVTAAAMAPLALHRGAAQRAVQTGAQASVIFQPWQAWWPLGSGGHVVKGSDGVVKAGYRTPPSWLGPLPHPVIAGLVVPLTLLWWRRRGRAEPGRAPEDALALLALLLLARCVLDPWDTGYYHLPFLLALGAWEALRAPRPPVLSLAAACAVWLTFERLPAVLGPDLQCASYLAWALPLAGWLTWRCFGRAGRLLPG